MNTASPGRDPRDHARREAARQLTRLGVDKNQPIDIFKIIQDAGIWLMFQPLKNLYGAYIPQTDAIGIIIHSGHPLSLQRYTAAHEFAHYVLRHPVTCDDSETIWQAGHSSDVREVTADTFAANFLMPLQLVNIMLERMGLPRNPRQLTDVQAYQLSLNMGVSYAATINQLVSLKKISFAAGEQLRKPPKSIKAQIAGTPLENSWADVWLLEEKDTGRQLNLRVNDELSISLPETPTTGYIWMLEDAAIADATTRQNRICTDEVSASRDTLFGAGSEQPAHPPAAAPLALMSSDFESNPAPEGQTRFGSSGSRYLRLRSLRSGSYSLRLLKRRPWQTASPPAEVFEVHLRVADKAHGVSEQQRPLLANAA